MNSFSKIRKLKFNLLIALLLGFVTFISAVDLHYVIGAEFELVEFDNECKESNEKETEKEAKFSYKLASNQNKETVKVIELRSHSICFPLHFIKEIPTPPPRV